MLLFIWAQCFRLASHCAPCLPDLHAAKPANNANYAKQYEQFILRGVKLHDTFQINDQETVRLDGTGWPAFANIWTEPANFLLCNPPQGQDFAYALCYYSGPDDPSGLSSDNPALPCTLSPNGKSADCKCFKLDTAVVPPQVPYFVDINAILNLDIYQQTVRGLRRGWSGLRAEYEYRGPRLPFDQYKPVDRRCEASSPSSLPSRSSITIPAPRPAMHLDLSTPAA